MTNYNTILYQKQRKGVLITLDRPNALNAMNEEMMNEFDQALSEAETDPEIRAVVITGAGDGIMGAAQRGAGRERSFGLNIRLPFEQEANVNIKDDRKLIDFNYFFTRKLNFVKETHAFALFPGGFGTMDEGFEALALMQTGKALIIPIVLIDEPGKADAPMPLEIALAGVKLVPGSNVTPAKARLSRFAGA